MKKEDLASRSALSNSLLRISIPILLLLVLAAASARAALPDFGLGKAEIITIPFRGNTVTIKLPPGRNKDYRAAIALMKLDGSLPEAEKALVAVVAGKNPPPEAFLALGVCREALGPEHFAAAKTAYTQGYAAARISHRIKEECEAGIARIKARENFVRKAQ